MGARVLRNVDEAGIKIDFNVVKAMVKESFDKKDLKAEPSTIWAILDLCRVINQLSMTTKLLKEIRRWTGTGISDWQKGRFNKGAKAMKCHYGVTFSSPNDYYRVKFCKSISVIWDDYPPKDEIMEGEKGEGEKVIDKTEEQGRKKRPRTI